MYLVLHSDTFYISDSKHPQVWLYVLGHSQNRLLMIRYESIVVYHQISAPILSILQLILNSLQDGLKVNPKYPRNQFIFVAQVCIRYDIGPFTADNVQLCKIINFTLML